MTVRLIQVEDSFVSDKGVVAGGVFLVDVPDSREAIVELVPSKVLLVFPEGGSIEAKVDGVEALKGSWAPTWNVHILFGGLERVPLPRGTIIEVENEGVELK